MPATSSTTLPTIFCSYSHKASNYKDTLETFLAPLTDTDQLSFWSDSQVMPGLSLTTEIEHNLRHSDIILFLISPDFLASSACMQEWHLARQLASTHAHLHRIPIIIRDCAWESLLRDEQLLALPHDPLPVTAHANQDAAWKQVYDGISRVLSALKTNFTAKPDFIDAIQATDFLTTDTIRLNEVYVFLPLISQKPNPSSNTNAPTRVTSSSDLLTKPHALVHGDDQSGKTSLARHLFLTLIDRPEPVLLLDAEDFSPRTGPSYLPRAFRDQFHGDYDTWLEIPNKTLIVDNFSSRPDLLDFLEHAQNTFDRIILTVSTTHFYTFFRDEPRLADYEVLEIGLLTQAQQESLIRKRLALAAGNQPMNDGYVDKVEDRVNAIIIDNHIVPRYPFYVLCILQTHEAYMPDGLAITSYGHCYYALIVASLVRAGVSKQDSDINSCLNFAEHLALHIYRNGGPDHTEPIDLKNFISQYKTDYFITNSTLSRLQDRDFGLIGTTGMSRSEYMYYYFLGKMLAGNDASNREIIQRMCDDTTIRSNVLTLLFIIHHTRNQDIVDEILLRTMTTLEDLSPATFDRSETARFDGIVSTKPKTILPNEPVESARQRERESRDDDSGRDDDDDAQNGTSEDKAKDLDIDLHRVLKNNEITGQILRNTYGRLPKRRIEDIIDVMIDSGLRLINIVFGNDEEIGRHAEYVAAANPEYDRYKIERVLRYFAFIWTMFNLEHVVKCVGVPEIKEAITSLTRRTGTPAYELIGYFALLDTADTLSDAERKELVRLFKAHSDFFVRGVLSLRTQHYMNTHRSKAAIEQSVCATRGIKYVPRLVRPGERAG